MSLESTLPAKKIPVVKIAIALVVLAIIGALLLREVGIARMVAWLDQFIAFIRDLGPWVFFTGMALLPAVGAPLSPFNLVAGEAFASQMTMTGVVAAALFAIAVNLALTYWLARYALRPWLTHLVARYGYQVPSVTKANALSVTVIVRNTGAPFFVQGFLLGIAEAPFRLYMIVSWVSVLPWAVSFIVLGKAAREGSFGKIATVVVVLVVAMVAFQLFRKKFAKREG